MGIGLLHDDTAVSPVVGVTLMVAITVILAASTAAFVFGVAGNRTDNTPPKADFTYEYSQTGNGELMLIYEGGDTLDPSQIEITTSGGQFHPAPGNRSSPSGPPYTSLRLDSTADGNDWMSGDIAAGAEFGVVGESSLEQTTVRIVWHDPSGGRTVQLGEWQGPDA